MPRASQFRIQYRPDGESVVNLGYRFQRGSNEQQDCVEQTSIEQMNCIEQWRLRPPGRWANAGMSSGRYVYSLLDTKTLDEFAGFEFKACCYRLRAVARRSVSNRDGKSETGIYIQLELNGLASVGTSADAFLERTIRGYSRESSSPGKPTP